MSFRRLGLLFALPTVVGLSLAACGTEDDAAPGPSGGSGTTAGSGGTGANGGTGGTGAEAGTVTPEGGTAGEPGPGPGPGGAGGAGGDSAEGGLGGDGPGIAGDGNTAGAGGEGGQTPPVACNVVIQNFNTDPGGAMGKYLTPDTGPVQSSTVEWSSTEGVAAPGAGKLNATFGALSEQAQLSLYPSLALPCVTKLHAKVKLLSATDLSQINGLNFSINSGSGTATRYAAQFTGTGTWAMDTWYAVELPFATANYQNPSNTLPDFTHVTGIGFQLQTKATGTTPVPVTMYVDDVWVE